MSGPSLPLRAMVELANFIGRRTEGYAVPFLATVLQEHGILDGMSRLNALAGLMTAAEQDLGERDAHLLVGFASLFNACEFCSVGHVYAAALAEFDETGGVFPIDEADVRRWLDKRDHEVLGEAEARLAPKRYADSRRWLRRLYELKSGDAATDSVDRLLVRIVAAYDWLNFCSVTPDDEEHVPPLSKRAKDTKLIERYRAARHGDGAFSIPGKKLELR